MKLLTHSLCPCSSYSGNQSEARVAKLGMESHILVIHPKCASKTGNYSTAKRISDGLKNVGYDVECMDVQSALAYSSLQQHEILSSIHALHSHILLEKLDSKAQKLVLIFGGTDLNECYKNQDDLNKMTDTVETAQNCVAFSENMKEQAATLWPEHQSKFIVIHQGISTHPSDLSWRNYLTENHSIVDEKIVLLVAGIRPVKDPLFILHEFKEWLEKDKISCSLVIVGPILDEDYGKIFMESVAQYRDNKIFYIGELSTPDTHAAIAQSDVLINTSISEGMAATILEAFDLCTPVVARNNSGNSSLIQHEENGLLFNTPQECMVLVERALSDSHLSSNLVTQAKEDVTHKYNAEIEMRKYSSLLKELTQTKT